MNFSKYWRNVNKTSFPQIEINNEIIEVVDTFKYLGVINDNELRFSAHLEACVRNANSKIYMFNKINK